MLGPIVALVNPLKLLWNTCTLFTPASDVWGFQSLHILANACHCLFDLCFGRVTRIAV